MLCYNRLGGRRAFFACRGREAAQSPGALLLKHQIEEASANGIAFYNIGVGQTRRKDEWCDVVQPLFDMFIALRPRGLLLTLPLAAMARLKRAIKSSRNLWPMMGRLRRRSSRAIPSSTAQIAAMRPSSSVRPPLPLFS
jgi:CelD/BcsL family acetyltransferase involved in cellulose biosynthesis